MQNQCRYVNFAEILVAPETIDKYRWSEKSTFLTNYLVIFACLEQAASELGQLELSLISFHGLGLTEKIAKLSPVAASMKLSWLYSELYPARRRLESTH